jgi:hypothetical protein
MLRKAEEASMSHEHYADRAHPEFVVLEIGGEVGALIIHTEPDLHGKEIEISPTGEDQRRSHKEVLERSSAGVPAYTAVFDQIPAGRYTLWVDGHACEREVLIAGGEIAQLDWRREPVASRR